MDGTTFDQFQTAFGDPISDIRKGIDKLCNTQLSQVDSLTKLQQLIGQKVDLITDYQKEITKKATELTNYAKDLEKTSKSAQSETSSNKSTSDKSTDKTSEGLSSIKLVSSSAKTVPSSLKVLPVRVVNEGSKSKEKNDKGVLGGIASMFTGLFGGSKAAKSPHHHDSINLLIPSETEVQLQNIIGDTLKPYFDRQDHKADDLFDVTGDIYKLMVSQSKKTADEPWWKKLLGPLLFLGPLLGRLIAGIPGFLLGLGKQIIPLVSRLLGPLMPLLAGAGLAVAGLMTLLSGFKDTGPMKGLKKILGKGLLYSGVALIKKQLSKLTTIASEALSNAARGIKKGFRNIIARVLKFSKSIFGSSATKSFMDAVKEGAESLFSKLKSLPGKLFKPISSAVKGLFKGNFIGSMLSKVGKAGGLIAGLTKGLGTFLKGALKKIPIIGSIISIGYAYSRFKNGDMIGGTIDTLNALTGLLYLIPGAGFIAFPLSLGLDALNAFLDYKAGGATGKQQNAKMDIFKGMLEWISKKIKYVPIIGPLAGMGVALMEGKWGEALKQLAKGVIPPLGVIVDLFENKEAVGKAVVKSIDFIGSISKWLFDKFKYVPVIGPLIGMVESVTEGKWMNALGYLAKAAIPPLGILIDLLDNKEAVNNAAVKSIDFIGSISKWLFDRFKYVPVIGPLMGMVESATEGKWLNALGYLAKAAIPPLGILIDLLDNKEAVGETVTKSIDFIGSISKWLFDRFKYVPVIGPLMGMVESVTEGKWMDALGYLAKAAIPPLGILIDLLDNKEAISNAAVATGDWLGQAASWVYDKAKSIPIIGPLIKAGEAIAGGKWDEVLGFLGEAIEPLQYIGGLIAGGVKSAAIDVGGGIADFFSSMKDSLLRAVLLMIPDITIGTFSLRKTVAGLLGITDVSTSASSASIDVNTKTGAQTVTTQIASQSNNAAAVDASQNQSQRSVANIKPAEETSQRTTPDTGDDSGEDFEGMHDSIKEHTGYLKGLIYYQKQTAANTKLLIEALKNSQLNAGKTVNVSSVSSPTTFISSPASSTSFRASMVQ